MYVKQVDRRYSDAVIRIARRNREIEKRTRDKWEREECL